MRQAFDNVYGPVFNLSSDMLQQGVEASRLSPRKRIILPIHRKQDAGVQRMLNFLQPDTYIRPHRHTGTDASESVCVIRGSLHFMIFDDIGNISHHFEAVAGEPSAVFDIEPGLWHSFFVIKPDTIIFEAKKGPYHPISDKDFAPWAPEEFTPASRECLKKWLDSYF